MKIGEVIKKIKRDGWYLMRIKGSHRQYKHPNKKSLITISGHLKDDLARVTLSSILKQSGLKEVKEDG
jgi:predicted RNA binding protein YcfA (HicA-like mRNA interferase family)